MESQEYPLTSERFVVSIASKVVGFAKVSGLKLKADEFQAKNEGGSDVPLFLAEQRKSMNTLTLEKGIVYSGKQKDGTKDLLSLAGKPLWDLIIMVYGKDRKVKRAYSANYAVVKEVSLSDLNALSPETLVEHMTVIYDILRPLDSKQMSGMEPLPTSSKNNSAGVGVTAKAAPKTSSDRELSAAAQKNQQIRQTQQQVKTEQIQREEQERKARESRVEF